MEDTGDEVRLLLEQCCVQGGRFGCGEGCQHASGRKPGGWIHSAGRLPRTGALAPDVRRDLTEIAGAPPTGGNAVRLLSDGADSFGAILDLVRAADRLIQFENFIFRADSVGRAFAGELRRRAESGVTVRVLHDPLGTLMAGRLPVDLLFRRTAVQVAMFNLRLGKHGEPRLGRDHRKLVVTDSRTMVAGGICLADPWAGNCVRHCTWRDAAVQVKGPVVTSADAAFEEAWTSSRPLIPGRTPATPGPSPGAPSRPVGEVPIRILASLGTRRLAASILGRMLDAAEHEILITNPYFVPPPHLRDALRGAAARGVDVCLLLPGRNNHRVVGASAEHGLGGLLDTSTRVFLWDGAMLHAKSVVIDRIWTLIGSSNLDTLSLERNAELDVEIHGSAVGEAMARLFWEDCSLSRPFTLDDWRSRSKAQRVAARAAWSLRRWQ